MTTTLRRMIGGLAIAAALAAGALVAPPAAAKKSCGADGYWCSRQCGAWNNWCRPACGEWNAWCAGQSLPNVLSRIQTRSYFADPRWVGESFANPRAWDWDDDRLAPPKAKRKASRRD